MLDVNSLAHEMFSFETIIVSFWKIGYQGLISRLAAPFWNRQFSHYLGLLYRSTFIYVAYQKRLKQRGFLWNQSILSFQSKH